LQPHIAPWNIAKHFGFNPYRVFKFVATEDQQNILRASGQFQSLSGFQVRCNFSGRTSSSPASEFQSLSGFQVRCNPESDPLEYKFLLVSIPIGFSSSLQLPMHPGCRFCILSVSIPIGFSSSLQHQSNTPVFAITVGFNPYRVFKFVATSSYGHAPGDVLGFNPYRVFKFVATAASSDIAGVYNKVSIPIGFSSSLQRREWFHLPARCDNGFNPYRVFKFVATNLVFTTPTTHSFLFQSLSGFQVRCNGTL